MEGKNSKAKIRCLPFEIEEQDKKFTKKIKGQPRYKKLKA